MGFDFLIVGPSRLAPTVVTQSVRFHGGGALIRCNKLHASTCTVAVVVFKYSKGAVYYDIHEERKNVCDVAEFQIGALARFTVWADWRHHGGGKGDGTPPDDAL